MRPRHQVSARGEVEVERIESERRQRIFIERLGEVDYFCEALARQCDDARVGGELASDPGRCSREPRAQDPLHFVHDSLPVVPAPVLETVTAAL